MCHGMACGAGGLAAGEWLIMYWQRRLPHWVPQDAVIFVTWRLAGTLPQPKPSVLAGGKTAGATFALQDRELDRTPFGPRWLNEPRIASIVVEALLYGESVRHLYVLFAWVVMPNHVHVVFKPTLTLPETMRWLKTATAVRANALMGRHKEAFWQREYYDHWLRSEKELFSAVRYVENNPVTAALVPHPEAWRWSSAWNGGAGGLAAGVLSSHLPPSVS